MKDRADSTSYVFDGFHVDADRRLLRDAAGNSIPLAPKAYETLYYLVSHAGQVIDKDELLSAIWPDTVVEENNLNKNISVLRRVLGENPAEHRFIATVPGRGFKFVADVEAVPNENSRNAIEHVPESTGGDGRRVRWAAPLWVLTATIVALGVTGIVVLYSGSSASIRAPISSVAVLPFHNVSADPELDYVSGGISENLIDRLSELDQLKVIARSSSFKFRDSHVDLQEVAQKLGVQAIVTGSVERRGEDIVIRVDLIDARDNEQIWGERFIRNAGTVVALESEIAKTVSTNLRLKLSRSQETRLDKLGTNDPRAYELLLMGDFLDRTMRNWPKAIESYEQAIALDPNYALAYARLAHTYGHLGGNSMVDPGETRPKARAAAQKAVELDSDLADAHLELANLARDTWDWTTAESEYRLTLQLNPSHRSARGRYTTFLAILGRHEEALVEARRGKELDPEQLSSHFGIARAHLLARRFDEAVIELNRLLELEPDSIGMHSMLGLAYAGKGMYREAITEHTDSIRLGNKLLSNQIYLGAAYARVGDRKKAREILLRLENEKEYVSPAELSILYIALGDQDRAFAALDKAYATRDLQLQYLNADAGFDPLRNDERFRELVSRVGLPQ